MPADDRVTRRLYTLVLPYRRTVALGMLCLLGSVAAELTPPLIWRNVVDVGLARRDLGYVAWQLVILVALFAVGQVLSAWRGLLLERAGQQLTLDLRLKLYAKLQGQSAAYFSRHRTGDLLSRVTADVEGVQDVLVRGTDAVVANALRLVGVAGIFIALQPLLGVVVLLPMVAVGLLLTRYNRNVRPTYRAARARLGNLGAVIADGLGGVRVIQSFARERQETERVATIGRALYEDQLEAVRLRNRVFPVIRFVSNFGNVLMLGGGVLLILRGQFTLGGLLAYRGYGRYFFGPIDDLVSINDLVQRAEAAGRRLFEVLDAPEDVRDAPGARELPRPLRGDLRFEDVRFSYAEEEGGARREVLRGLTLHVRPGERVAILGESGAGKSTLLGLVNRTHDPTSGVVRIDGVDLRDVTLASLRSQVGVVQQDTFLFHASVRDNVRFARPDATDAQVEAALAAARALDFVRALPGGLDTVVGERGVKLSGGQRQRLSIARTLLADPPMLLLDEPTSAVDPESEALIVEALERLLAGRTALIVTHRPSLARGADRVLVMRDGVVDREERPALS